MPNQKGVSAENKEVRSNAKWIQSCLLQGCQGFALGACLVRNMRVLKLLPFAIALFVAVLPLGGISAAMEGTQTAHSMGMISFISSIPQYLQAAGEPFKLMMLGVGLILLAIRLRQTAPVDSR